MVSAFVGTGLLRSRSPRCIGADPPSWANAIPVYNARAVMAAILMHVLRSFDGISPPQPFERFRKRLLFHWAITVHRIPGKHKLVVVPFGAENLRNVPAGHDPVVHVVAHDIWIEEIPVSNPQPDSNRLDRAIRDEPLMKFPRTVRRLRAARPLLVHSRDRIRK